MLFITLKHHESLPHHLISKLTKELELYRVFDSLTFEDEDSEKFETGIKTTGDLSEEQTKEFMYLAMEDYGCWCVFHKKDLIYMQHVIYLDIYIYYVCLVLIIF